jgi:hypothetical protein
MFYTVDQENSVIRNSKGEIVEPLLGSTLRDVTKTIKSVYEREEKVLEYHQNHRAEILALGKTAYEKLTCSVGSWEAALQTADWVEMRVYPNRHNIVLAEVLKKHYGIKLEMNEFGDIVDKRFKQAN